MLAFENVIFSSFFFFIINLQNVRSATKIEKMFFLQPIILRSFKESMFLFFTNGYLSLKFENFAVLSKNIHYYFNNKSFIR